MKNTITKLSASIIATAGELAADAERLPSDAGISGAECIIHIRDAQRCMRAAQDAMRLAVAQQGDDNLIPSL